MRGTRRRIVMDMDSLRETFLQSWFGMGYGRTMYQTGLRKGQVGYRRRLFQETLGMQEGFCQRWQRGHHPLQSRIFRDYVAVAEAEFERRFLPRIIHVPPKVAPIIKSR